MHQEVMTKGSEPLRRAASVLECVVYARKAMTISEIGRRIGLPQPTAHRLVMSLAEIGYLERIDGGLGYTIGNGLLRLLHAGLRGASLFELIGPTLSNLATDLGESCFVTHLVDDRIEIAAEGIPRGEHQSLVKSGNRFPFHATASGKVILSHQSDEFVRGVLRRPLERFTTGTIHEKEKLLRRLKKVRQQGFDISDEEMDDGVYSVAVPIALPSVGVIYSLGVVGLKERFGREFDIDELVARLNKVAARLADILKLMDR